jgi:hypothetical protein
MANMKYHVHIDAKRKKVRPEANMSCLMEGNFSRMREHL